MPNHHIRRCSNHLLYVYNGCEMQSEVVYGLNPSPSGIVCCISCPSSRLSASPPKSGDMFVVVIV
jgi:hypothetical protein